LKYEIIVFASRDTRHTADARALADAVGGRFIDRQSTRLEDLLLVARYRVVEPVVVVVLCNGQVQRRFTKLVKPETILGALTLVKKAQNGAL
jgi:hypothetical protein